MPADGPLADASLARRADAALVRPHHDDSALLDVDGKEVSPWNEG